MKLKLFLFTIAFLLPIFTYSSVTANALAEDTETPIASSSQEITDSVVEKIKSVVKNNPSPSLTPTPTLLGIVGTVDSISDNSLSLTTKQEVHFQTTISEETDIVKNKKAIALKDVPIDNKIILIGLKTNSQDILLAKRIILVPPSNPTVIRSPIYGTITNISTKNKTITLLKPDQSETEIEISQASTPPLKELEIDQKLFAIIETDTQDSTNTLLKAKIL